MGDIQARTFVSHRRRDLHNTDQQTGKQAVSYEKRAAAAALRMNYGAAPNCCAVFSVTCFLMRKSRHSNVKDPELVTLPLVTRFEHVPIHRI